jgi:hypothetical protein
MQETGRTQQPVTSCKHPNKVSKVIMQRNLYATKPGLITANTWHKNDQPDKEQQWVHCYIASKRWIWNPPDFPDEALSPGLWAKLHWSPKKQVPDVAQ